MEYIFYGTTASNSTYTSNTFTRFAVTLPAPRLPHVADQVPVRLISRILRVAALEARAGTEGERDAAACALLRLWDRAGVRAKDRAVVLAELRRRAEGGDHA